MNANTWIEAGNAEADIDIDELERRFGECPATDWEGVCQWAYRKLTGTEMPHCTMRGRGSRSRFFGEQVYKVWKDAS